MAAVKATGESLQGSVWRGTAYESDERSLIAVLYCCSSASDREEARKGG